MNYTSKILPLFFAQSTGFAMKIKAGRTQDKFLKTSLLIRVCFVVGKMSRSSHRFIPRL